MKYSKQIQCVKIGVVGIFSLLLLPVISCTPTAPETFAPPPVPPKTSSVPPESETALTAPQKVPPALPETAGPPPAPETPPIPSVTAKITPTTQEKYSSPKTQPKIASAKTPSLFVETPGDFKNFHIIHPVNRGGTCVSGECHALKKKVKYVHAPVATGACELCHRDLASSSPNGVSKTKANTELCFKCHKQQKASYNQARFIHQPAKENCTSCHNAHGSETSKYFLTKPQVTLCLDCHQNPNKNPQQVAQIKPAKVPHRPVMEGKCAACHAPHASNFKKLMKEGPQETGLCFSCHKEKASEMEKASSKHGPIRDGLCSSCHAPHGSDSPKLLKYFFVKKFYNPYDPKLYALCFQCHKETLVIKERTRTLTNFRNGDRNLHYLHVHRKKGRTCLACHEIHASSQERHIRLSTPFGDWNIPIEFTKNATGGKCAASCHVEKQYDRDRPLKLDIDIREEKQAKEKPAKTEKAT